MTMLAPRSLLLLAALLSLLAGCSGWPFGRSDPTTLEPEGGYAAVALDTRPLVGTVTAVTLEPTPGGAILTATGLTSGQGYWDVGLVRDRSADLPDTARRYTFHARPPVDADGAPVATSGGPAATRQVTAAVFIGGTSLAGLRQITVVGADGSRTARR
ncbi:hypothetical protein DKT77_08400 [Meridianimarinicoccus roseus]|uniref:Uncharacterized protein n=1 Tax=Meridianimarinicoccus roseus TaxID=2072018 RepID=A0A2V2LBZ3_9RHOB|nr:hypothetical protein [Meridianimarinicoccus roseus]PWR02958.1 hypothetical protein DKT77_08400 [Meridianimarinicoccus roseus]